MMEPGLKSNQVGSNAHTLTSEALRLPILCLQVNLSKSD